MAINNYLICNNKKRLVCEQGTYVVEERFLRLQSVAALLARVDEVEHGRPEVRQGRDGLEIRFKEHLNTLSNLKFKFMVWERYTFKVNCET